MSSESACLVLRLEGPLQSWGVVSQFNHRLTSLLPTRSAVTGLLCVALGLERGSQAEADFLTRCNRLHMRAVMLPLVVEIGETQKTLPVRRLEDYHTVKDTLKASGAIKDCHITWRQYLLDAAFRVFLQGDRVTLEETAAALQDPVWGVWLGRKACIPSAPVFAGLYASEDEALQSALPLPLERYTAVLDAPSFAEGDDSVPDMPLSFDSAGRRFGLRRTQTVHGH